MTKMQVKPRATGQIDEAKLRELVEAGNKSRDVAVQLGWSRSAVLRKADKLGLVWSTRTRGPSEHRAAVVPAGFKRWAAGKSITQVVDRYGCGTNTALAWFRATGVERFKAAPPKPKNVKAKPFRAVNTLGQMGQARQTIAIDTRDDSRAGRAADTLRGERWIVYRCNQVGAATQGGAFWRLGRLVVTDAELIERADRVIQKRAA